MTRKKQIEHSTQPQTVQTVAEAEAVLQKLEAKRLELQAQAEELSASRKAASFRAHTGDGDHRLVSIMRSIREVDANLSTLSEAIHEGRNRLAVAQAREQQAAAEANAARILELTGKLKAAGQRMDDACKTLTESSKELSGLLLELHGLGVHHPNFEQWKIHGSCALQTAVLNTPWARDFRPLPPDRRKQFGPLISSWAVSIESRVRVPKREAA